VQHDFSAHSYPLRPDPALSEADQHAVRRAETHALCCQELGREPKTNELFLFYNTKRDTLKLFWRDGNGSQEITKALPRGGFMLPAPKDGEAFVTLAPQQTRECLSDRKKMSQVQSAPYTCDSCRQPIPVCGGCQLRLP